MKVKTNWSGHNIYVGQENGIFDRKGDDVKKEPSKADFYIIKKQKKADKNFSTLLINEFNGLRISDSRAKSLKSFLEKSEKEDLISRKHSAMDYDLKDSDLKAVNFLNGYWA
jgi:hypothetical protein